MAHNNWSSPPSPHSKLALAIHACCCRSKMLMGVSWDPKHLRPNISRYKASDVSIDNSTVQTAAMGQIGYRASQNVFLLLQKNLYLDISQHCGAVLRIIGLCDYAVTREYWCTTFCTLVEHIAEFSQVTLRAWNRCQPPNFKSEMSFLWNCDICIVIGPIDRNEKMSFSFHGRKSHKWDLI